ncbi:40S ribosomal protein S20 [Dictyocoela muelleri]|nr:40S ribosomal protein S20 [Dictyocoela muelleri]
MIETEKKIDFEEQTEQKINLRIKMQSTKKNSIEQLCRDFYEFASQEHELSNPVMKKPLDCVVTTRKSPCGQGTATFSKFKMFIYESYVDVVTTHSFLSRIASFMQNSDVAVSFSIN